MTYHQFLDEWRSDAQAIACHTSGSTGSPKDIWLPKPEVARSAQRTIEFFNLGKNSRLHSCISPDYIGGKMMAVRSEVCGGILSWEMPSNMPLIKQSITLAEDNRPLPSQIDLLAVVPSQMIYILDHLQEIPPIGNIIIGGAPIPDDLRVRIAQSGLSAWETYGMTETASHIALRRVAMDSEWFETLPGIIVSTDARETLRINIDGWQTFSTNDICELQDEHNFKIIGRADNVIITGGKKVHPEQVEKIIEAFTACEVLITSHPDRKWGERVILLVDEGCKLTVDEISEFCHCQLPDYCVPKEVIKTIVPHTPNGKKQRSTR